VQNLLLKETKRLQLQRDQVRLLPQSDTKKSAVRAMMIAEEEKAMQVEGFLLESQAAVFVLPQLLLSWYSLLLHYPLKSPVIQTPTPLFIAIVIFLWW
jgi:hypothetical protein